MVKCNDCNQEMREAERCTWPYLVVDGVRYKRDTEYYDWNPDRCHDCAIINKPGNVHHFGCDIERCPICKGQLISCGCLEGKEVSIAMPSAE